MVEVKEGVRVVKGFKAYCPFLFFRKKTLTEAKLLPLTMASLLLDTTNTAPGLDARPP